MSLQIINLRKLLKLMFLDQRDLTAALRSDIRDELQRERGQAVSGGDFYAPFWKDAKDHVFDLSDLQDSTAKRIADNGRRGSLYPRLKNGFLLWWTQRRRWTNAPFNPIDSPKIRYNVPGLGVVVKIDAVLSVRDGQGKDRYIYPYWFPEPSINDEGARIGLWILIQSLPHIDREELRILDVMRGVTFSLDKNPLLGNEEEIFFTNFKRLEKARKILRDQYDD